MASDRSREIEATERGQLKHAFLADVLRWITGIAGVLTFVLAVHASGAVSALSQAWGEMVGRRLIVYAAKGEQMLKTSPPWVDAEGNTNSVTTEGGVNPPLKLVPADYGDLSNESPQQFSERHRARVAEAQRLWPPA